MRRSPRLALAVDRDYIACREQRMAETNNTDVKKMPFEGAIEELETIVKRLEEGKVPLEESVAIYERGEVLKTRCEELLRAAEARVEKITLARNAMATRFEFVLLGTDPVRLRGAGEEAACPLEVAGKAAGAGDRRGMGA